VRILQYDGTTALVEVYLAPGIVSGDVVQQLSERFELLLAEFSDRANVFLKKIHRRDDYYALIAVESPTFSEVASVAQSLEKRTRHVASQVKHSVFSAINRLG
jgi:deoxyribodipyrimidine photolyase